MKNRNTFKEFLVCLIVTVLLSMGFAYPSSAATTMVINDGDAIRAIGTADVYIVKIVGPAWNQKKFKRLILNERIFDSYSQLSWGRVEDIDQVTIGQFANSNLVIHVNANGIVVDPRVWSVTSAPNSDIGVKRWLNVTAEQLIRSGIDQDSIYKINDLEASDLFYGSGPSLAASDDLIGWATSANGVPGSAVASHKVTVSGRVTDTSSNAMPGIVLTCNGKTLATTDASGNYSFQLNVGDEYCVRISNPPSNSKIYAIHNRLNSNYNSYEYQIAGRGAVSTDNMFERDADRDTDSGTDFTILVQAPVQPSQTPSVTSIFPLSVTAGDGSFTLDVNGANFNAFSNIIWGGTSALGTQFLSITHLAAIVPASFVASGTTVSVSVNNSSGGGMSNGQTLTINNPVPTIASISPSTLPSRSGAFTLSVNGTHFVPTSAILWNGSPRTTTFVSATQLTAAMGASDIASTGTAQVAVNNPTPAGGTSAVQTFTATNP